MEHFKWSVEVYHFRVLRVSSFNGLYSAPRPFLLTLTTVNVDTNEIVQCHPLSYWGEPERAPHGQFNEKFVCLSVCLVRFR